VQAWFTPRLCSMAHLLHTSPFNDTNNDNMLRAQTTNLLSIFSIPLSLFLWSNYCPEQFALKHPQTICDIINMDLTKIIKFCNLRILDCGTKLSMKVGVLNS
jgi:hypothetical protein